MRVEVAKTAGFCFGVDRAVSTVYKLLEEGKQAATLGLSLIHISGWASPARRSSPKRSARRRTKPATRP